MEIGERGGVVTDDRLATSAPDVFAAGDIAEFECAVHAGALVRIEHWDVAETQGRTAALNMLGRDAPHDTVPYFFSDLADWTSMEYVGPAYGWSEEIVRGSIEDGEFTVYYLDGDRLAAALTSGAPTTSSSARELILSRARRPGRRGGLRVLRPLVEDFVESITRGQPGVGQVRAGLVVLALAAYQLILAAIG